MEEQRIGVMYWNLVKSWFVHRWDHLFPRGLRRSSTLPFLVILTLVALPSLGYYLHMRGRFSILKRQIKGERQGPAVSVARPGGVEPLVLTRTLTLGSNMAEFRSVTLLPGLGMDVLQLTASLPERGEMQLLAAPTAEDLVNGTAPARTGVNDAHGALEAPWGGLLMGMPTPVGTTIRTVWHGNAIEVPSDGVDSNRSSGGLLTLLSTDTAETTTQPQGEVTLATFHASDFNQHWPSKTDILVDVTLGPRTLELTVTAKNVGDQPEPMGVGWHPRFTVPSGDRDGAEVRLPLGEQMEFATAAQGVPSGRFGVARCRGATAARSFGAAWKRRPGRDTDESQARADGQRHGGGDARPGEPLRLAHVGRLAEHSGAACEFPGGTKIRIVWRADQLRRSLRARVWAETAVRGSPFSNPVNLCSGRCG